jgi:inner membrane transporter RhtA
VTAGSRAFAVALVLAAVGVLQFGAALAATLFDELGPGGTAFLRLGLAALVVLALARPRARGHGAGGLRLAAAFGLVLGGMNWAIYESISRIPLGIAVTIEFIGPLGVALLASRRALDGLWVALAAAGILLLAGVGEGTDLDAAGVLLALVAGTLWAGYILLGARTGRRFPGLTGLALALPFGALLTAPAGVAQAGGALLEPELLALALVVALASSVIPYSLELEALRRLPAGVFGVLMSLEPAVAALAGLAVLGQDLLPREWAAIALVVAASAGAALGAREPIASVDA